MAGIAAGHPCSVVPTISQPMFPHMATLLVPESALPIVQLQSKRVAGSHQPAAWLARH